MIERDTSIVTSTPDHEAFHSDLVVVMRRHSTKLSAEDMLALTAHMVGKMAALQDQRKLTREMIMDLITKNIELGAATAIERSFDA